MADPKREERRRFPRSPLAAGWQVTCTQEQTPEPRNLSLRLIDLSRTGASLETTELLEQGSEVTLSLAALEATDRFRATATVCRAQTLNLDSGPRHVAGLRFVRVLETRGEIFGFMGDAEPSTGDSADIRRRGKRFVPPGAAVEINTPGLLARLGLGGKSSTQLQDLSRRGVRIASSRMLEPGSTVTIVIELLRPAVRLVTPGQVKWCRRDTSDSKKRWTAGIEFVQLSETDDEVLRTVDKFYLP